MKKLTLIGMILFTVTPCTSKYCKDLPSQFSSFNQAVIEVKSANFPLEEKVKTTKSEEYIHQNVPLSVCEQFKKADSFGKFYISNMKGSYQLKLI